MKLRFGECTFDLDLRRLVCAGRDVHLSPKAFEVLRALIDERGRACSKSELLERVWPGVFVSDGSLARVVAEIRDVIGDRARDGDIIRTVHGYGYAFAATVRLESPGPGGGPNAKCWLVSRNRTFALADGEHLVGREPDVSIWLDSPKVSARHARIVARGLDVTIEDLGSKNGTFVRGQKIAAPTRLEPGDDVRIGPITLTLRVARGPTSTETETVSV